MPGAVERVNTEGAAEGNATSAPEAPSSTPCSTSTRSSIWSKALKSIPPKNQRTLNKLDGDRNPDTVLKLARDSQDKAWQNRIRLPGPNSEKVFLHDILAKVAKWVEKFVQVGDALVQFDPTHAALPWAALRVLLTIPTNDVEKQGIVADLLEVSAQTIVLGSFYERAYLPIKSSVQETLAEQLLKLYALTLSSLATTIEYYDQNKFKRVAGSFLVGGSGMNADVQDLNDQLRRVKHSADLVSKENMFAHFSDSTERLKQLLEAVDDIKAPLARVDVNVERLNNWVDQQKRTEFLNKISTVPYPEHHQEVRRTVLPGTGRWLLDHSLLRKWLDSSASEMLWLNGTPGSGKTNLIAIVIEKLKTDCVNGICSDPLYFYCKRNSSEPDRANAKQIFKSVLRQLCETSDRAYEAVADCDRSSWRNFATTQDITELAIKVMDQRPVTHVIIDALDECDQVARDELTEALEKILKNCQSLVKIFVSSRNEWDLACWLKDYPNKAINPADSRSDIDMFINHTVDAYADGRPRKLGRSKPISNELRTEIKIALKRQAGGMFRWVELQLQYLSGLLKEDQIRKRLGSLPETLGDSYHEIYERSMAGLRSFDPQDEMDAKKVFGILLSSTFSWSPQTMAGILDPKRNLEDSDPEQVFRVTFSLVVVDEELQVLRFAHLSVREYFETRNHDFKGSKSHEWAAIACISYMEETANFKFRPVSYPGRKWVDHVESCKCRPFSEDLEEHLERFLYRSPKALRDWLRYQYKRSARQSFFAGKYGDSLFFACSLGLDRLIKLIIHQHPQLLSAKNEAGWDSLVLSCAEGQVTAIETLIQNHAPLHGRVGRSRSFSVLGLSLAASSSESAVSCLLEHGAAVDSREGPYQRTILELAAGYTTDEVVSLLLQHGADPNKTSDEHNLNALCTAILGDFYTRRFRENLRKLHSRDSTDDIHPKGLSERRKITKLLLENGADIQLRPTTLCDGLYSAVSAQDEELVSEILSHQPNVNLSLEVLFDRGELSPDDSLFIFTEEDTPPPVRGNSSTIVRENRTTTVIFEAFRQGNLDVVTMLIRVGADPTPQNAIDRMDLETFLRSNESEIAREVYSQTQSHVSEQIHQIYRKPLWSEQQSQIKERSDANPAKLACLVKQASINRNPTLLAQLLDSWLPQSQFDRSIVLDVAVLAAAESDELIFAVFWNFCETRLNFSRERQDVDSSCLNELYQLLLPSVLHRSPAAIFDRAVSTIASLVLAKSESKIPSRKSPEVDLQEQIRLHGSRFLRSAVASENCNLVEYLLQNGTDPRCLEPQLLCDCLRKSDDVAILRLLIKYGMDPNLSDMNGIMLLQHYVSLKKANHCQELLSHGADPNRSGDPTTSPLLTAISQKREDLVRLLLSHDADCNRRYSGEYVTALVAAVKAYPPQTSLMLRILMEHGAEMTHPGSDPSTLLHMVCSCLEDDNAESVKMLLSKGADINTINSGGTTALCAATTFSLVNKMQVLLANGADVNILCRADGHSTSPLHSLVFNSDISALNLASIQLLFEYEADVHSRAGPFESVLQAACAAEFPSEMIVAYLLDNGADPNIEGGVFGYPLIAAAWRHAAEVVDTLVDRGADVNVAHPIHGNVLYAACVGNNPESIARVLRQGASKTQIGGSLEHALFVACMPRLGPRGWFETPETACLQALIDGGIDVNLEGQKHRSALKLAVQGQLYDTAKLLTENGARLDAQVDGFGTLLHFAAATSSARIVKLLLQQGMDANTTAGPYHSVLQAACARHNSDVVSIIRLLLDKDADVHAQGGQYGTALHAALHTRNIDAASELLARHGVELSSSLGELCHEGCADLVVDGQVCKKADQEFWTMQVEQMRFMLEDWVKEPDAGLWPWN